MSKPTEQVYAALTSTVRGLIEEQGVGLLSQPLRLEGWLRDLHPDSRAAVSVVMEAIHTGVYLEKGTLSDVSALLSLRSGLSPQWSDFGARLWKSVLKGYDTERLMPVGVVHRVGNESPTKDLLTDSVVHIPTVEEVLGPYRNN